MPEETTPQDPNFNEDGTRADDFQLARVVKPAPIEDEMRASYLDYAMSVIVARALPDARDGLKPVHRRILYVMHDMGLHHNRPYKKSARIVGEVLGKYHPHGDSAVYDAMVRMAQNFSLRYPLVDGQGNFGSVDGDSAAAMRYTEARLARIASELLVDIEKDTVDWAPNFDESLQEPKVLPAKLPNLLLNGASGIAVGMATNIPPHNLGEVADALVYMIDRWDDIHEVQLGDLMQFVKGPDFPTGGIIMGMEGIKQAFATGRGRVIVRAKTEIEEMKSGRFRIIVTEIPYQVNKTTLIERIAALVREGRLDSISGLRDESDRKGMRIVIELKRGAVPRKELNKLFKYTFLQTTFGVNNLALVNNEPHTLPLKRMLMIYVDHRMEVITRRTRWERAQAEARLHILEGLRIALDFLDEVIKTIRGSATVDEARSALMEHFGLSQIQAQAILDMPLRRLAALERQKIENEYDGLKIRVDYLNGLLADPHKILMLIREDILYLRETYADERRTRIDPHGISEFREEDLVTQRGVIITLTQSNYIKRTDAKVFKAQGRGGKGVKGVETKAEDVVVRSLFARTLDHLLFFTNQGRVYSERAYNIPEGSRIARGYHVSNVLNLQNNETVTAVIPVEDFSKSEYIALCTRQGRIKRMALSEFARVRPSGIIAMNIPPGDELISVEVTSGDDEIVIVTRGGKVLRFHESAIRPMGRTATGVRGIRLLGDDKVTAMTAMDGNHALLIVTEQGWGKRVSPDDFQVKGRYTQGVWVTDHKRLDETGPIVVAMIVNGDEDVAFMTKNGIAMRTNVKDISILGRATRGVRCVRLQPGDALVSAARIEEIEISGPAADGEPSGEAATESEQPPESTPDDAESTAL